MVGRTPQGSTRAAVKSAAVKRLKKIHVEPTDNGGFVVRHHYQPEYGGTPAPDVHAFANYDGAHGHLAKHLKGRA